MINEKEINMNAVEQLSLLQAPVGYVDGEPVVSLPSVGFPEAPVANAVPDDGDGTETPDPTGHGDSPPPPPPKKK